MKKIITTICIASIPSVSMAKQIPTQLQKFVPQHWEIISQADGDLNADGQKDTVIIIQPKNHKIMNRKLLVLVKNNNTYQQQNAKSLPNWTYRDNENCMDGALSDGSVEIKNGILDLSFNDMNTCSNWYGQSWTYRFKWQKSQFRLTGFEYWLVYKTDGKATRHSGNFLTQKLKTTLYNEFDDQIQPKITWKKLVPIQPNTLDQIKFEQSDSFLKQMIK